MSEKILYLNLRHSDRVAVADKFAKDRVDEAIHFIGMGGGTWHVMDFCNETVLNWARVARKNNEVDSLVIMVGSQRIEFDSDGRIDTPGWDILEKEGLLQFQTALTELL